MKKIIIALIFTVLIVMLTGFLVKVQAQTIYTAHKTELLVWNPQTNEWRLDQTNYDVNIDVKFYNDRVFIDAENKRTFYTSNSRTITGKGWKGMRWDSYDYVHSESVLVDIITYPDTKQVILSIVYGSSNINTDGTILKYYF